MNMLLRLYSVTLLVLVVFSLASSGLRCWLCENSDLFNCKQNGNFEQCADNQKVCQTEIRYSDGKHLIVRTGCKQGVACKNNNDQNPAAAWSPSQCNGGKDNSVCRCCCEGNQCNKKREMLLCDFPEKRNWDAPTRAAIMKPEKSCGIYPEVPQNGKRECIGGYALRAFCKFTCEEGYKMVGYHMTICVQKGRKLRWNTDAPTCKKMDVCDPMPLEPVNGHSECSDNGNVGTVCGFACNYGYKLNGAPITTCVKTSDGAKWSHETPKCKPICKYLPTTPENGIKSCKGDLDIGAICIFQCKRGYEINGASETTCQHAEDGAEWSNESPMCEPVCKPLLKSPKNGESTCTGNGHVGTTCVYNCDAGYRMVGEPRVSCDRRAQGAAWSGKPPRCRPVCEPMPEAPLYGRIKCDGSGEVGTACFFECSSGTKIGGPAVTLCVNNAGGAVWDKKPPVCNPVCDPFPQVPIHGKRSCAGDGHVGTACTFQCETGYELHGAFEVMCKDKSPGLAVWSDNSPVCIPVCTPMPTAPLHGAVSCDGRGNIGTLCRFTCDEGFELTGALETKCRETQLRTDWTEESPVCTAIPSCQTTPPAPENGHVFCNGTGELGTTCTFRCNEEFEVKGNDTVTCRRNDSEAFWSSKPPSCAVVFVEPVCPTLGDFPNGKIVCDQPVNREGTVCRFECLELGYELMPPERIITRCNAEPDLKWTARKPCCAACSKSKKDIMIAMDSSGSIDYKEWKLMTKFVQKIVRKFNVSEESVQFSIFQFSSAARSDGFMYFGKYTKSKLINQIGKMRRMGTGTKTGKALEYAQRRFRDSGNRKDVGDVLWVFTDGETEDVEVLEKAANRLRKDGVEILALAIGPSDVFVKQMTKMTGDRKRVLVAKNVQSLSEVLVSKVTRKICEESCPK